MEWITAHFAELSAIVLAFMKFFELVARMTPTKADDNMVQKFRKFAAVAGMAVKDKNG